MSFMKIILNSLLITLLIIPFAIKANASLINAKTNQVVVKRDIVSTINSANLKEKSNWISYQVEMEPQNGMPCCFEGNNAIGCSLSERRNSWGMNQDREEDSKILTIYFNWIDNKPSELFLSGSECGVDAGGKVVTLLSKVSQQQSIHFLQRYLTVRDNKSHRQVSNKVLTAIALHKGGLAQNTLEKLANSADGKINHQAIFWLGEARNRDGYKALVKIIDNTDRKISTRKKVVFALSQNSFEKAKVKLKQLALKTGQDRIQAEAIFWLAQSQDNHAANVIEKVLTSDASRFVMKKAVFALHEIKGPESWDKLVSLAKDNANQDIRKEAIFWLSQRHDKDASSVLLQIIRQESSSRSIKDKTVFAISQLKEPYATNTLIQLIKGSDGRFVKKKALFWLGQSNQPEAMEVLEDILTASIN